MGGNVISKICGIGDIDRIGKISRVEWVVVSSAESVISAESA